MDKSDKTNEAVPEDELSSLRARVVELEASQAASGEATDAR